MAEYHVENFGCRASRSDGEAVAAGLRASGLGEAAGPAVATVVVLNTCSVTAEAERTARAFLRRLQRQNPEAEVVVTGCYAQRAPSEVAALPGVTAVVGNSHKRQTVEAALTAISQPRHPALVPLTDLSSARKAQPLPRVATILHDPLFAHAELSVLPFAPDARQTRPNLKVQDGCANRCSFCIIPVTRGPSRSNPLPDCLRAVHEFVESGGREIVLSGINLGRWGRDFTPAGARLENLVAAILEQTRLPRLRLSSVEPMDWSSELLALYRQYGTDVGLGPRLARHAHLPLQSGSDTILRRMHRRYRPWHYAARVEQIHAALPFAAIGADVMIGFPGETDALFAETYRFIEQLPLTYLHVFPFSARPGTTAFALHGFTPVSSAAVHERKAALKHLIDRKNKAFRQTFVGAALPAITLAGGDARSTPALSDNYLKVQVSGLHPPNQLLRVETQSLSADGLFATAALY